MRKKTEDEIEADKVRLYEILYRHGMTLPELAEEMGVTYNGLVATLKRGISAKTAARLAGILKEPIENFLPDDEVKFFFKCPTCGATHCITIK